MKGKKGRTVTDAWEFLLIANEAAAKRGKAMSDDELKAKMYAEFPKPDGRKVSTIERVRMVRMDYNAGRGMFAGRGPAGRKARPASFKYTDGRTPVEDRAYKRRGSKN